MRSRTIVAALALIVGPPMAFAADQPGDPISEVLIPPEIVMAHQQEIDLSDEQRNAIQADVQQAQAQFTPLQWQLSATVERLAGILKQTHVDENEAMAQFEKEQALERQVKQTQLLLMIRVKNELRPDQQLKALALKRAAGTPQ
jgi:hypothetical protein